MKVSVNGISYHVEKWGETGPVLVLLHGFTGSSGTWRKVAAHWQGYQVFAVDLIGHGATDSPDHPARYRMERQLSDLASLFEQLDLWEITLIGYSMGGRTALAFACEYPGRIERLVLESASPGLPTEDERNARRDKDASLAKSIMDSGIEAFVDSWQEIPLFQSQKSLPESVQQEVRKERLAQSPTGLANSLLGMGTGSQASYWERLEALEMPVYLITGELDRKFEAVAKKMMRRLPHATHRSIRAGHAIHVEKPAEFATMVKELLNGINEED